jgi:RNA polymerase sigma-70 factor (ECF subfamily)
MQNEVEYGRQILAIYSALRNYAKKLTRHRERAEDLAQTTVARLLDQRSAYDPTRELLPWAQVIMKRLFIDSIRKERTEERTLARLRLNSDRTEAVQEVRVELSEVLAHMENMQPARRKALLLGSIGFSDSEIATILERPHGTVKGYFRLGRGQLIAATQ